MLIQTFFSFDGEIEQYSNRDLSDVAEYEQDKAHEKATEKGQIHQSMHDKIEK